MKRVIRIIIAYTLLFSGFLFSGIYLFNTQLRLLSYILFYSALYMVLLPFIKIKWLKIPLMIIFSPLLLLMLITELLTPIFTWIITIIISTSIITILIYHLPEYLGFFISTTTRVYLCLTITSIILSVYGNKLFEIWLGLNDNQKKYKNLGLRIHNQKRTRFLIFVLYFLMIVLTTVFNLAEQKLFKIDRLDYAVLQSFATYIAFDRLVTTYSTTKLKEKLCEIKLEYMKIIRKKFNLPHSEDNN